MFHTLRLWKSRASDESGMAMVAVIGVLSIALVLSVAIAGSVVSAMAVTTSTRAGVQSQAAAEAGIAVARAGLIAGTCSANSGRYTSANPEFVVVVNPDTNGVGHCPVGLGTQVRLVSTGTANAPAVNGAAARDVTSLEAVLSAAVAPTSIDATGPAVYAYNSNGFSGSGTLVSVGGSEPDVLVKHGDLHCDGASAGATDLVVEGGNVRINGSCNVNGNVWASGSAIVDGGTGIGGNLVANGVTMSVRVGGSVWSSNGLTKSWGGTIGGTATVTGPVLSQGDSIGSHLNATGDINLVQTEVKGDLTTAGTLNFNQAQVRGDVVAKKLTIPGSGTMYKKATIYGTATGDAWGAQIQGRLTATGATFAESNVARGGTTIWANTSTPSVPMSAAPIRPTVPNWVDFTYKPDDWVGFSRTAISGGTCKIDQLRAAVTSFGGAPGVIDATGCTGGIELSGDDTLTIGNDIAIFAKKFLITGSGKIHNSGTTKRVWLITPDLTPNGLPTCAPGSSFTIDGGASFTNGSVPNHVMMYSPCRIILTSSTYVYGQVFAGEAGMNGGSRLAYVAIGLPGVDLNTGAVATPTGTEASRTLISQRNIEVG